MSYSVSRFDDSADGLEPLRRQSEFILLAYPGEFDSELELLESWLSDIDSCERFAGFDYAAARRAVESWVRSNVHVIRQALANVEAWPEDWEDWGITFRLYVEVSEEESADAT